MGRAERSPGTAAEQFHDGKTLVPIFPGVEGQLPPARTGTTATSVCRDGIPVIVKSGVVGINTALIHSIRGSGLADAIKQTKRKQNSMLNKLNNRRGGFTLVEIMIVVAIIALLAAIAVPGFLRARKRSQASRIINDLRLIDSAVDQYAIENNKTTGATFRVADWTQLPEEGLELSITPARTCSGTPTVRRRWTPCRRVPAHVGTLVGCGRQRVLVALRNSVRSNDSSTCHSRVAGVAGSEL